MRIIIEGFDGTGKSSLCRAFKTAFDCELFNASPSPPVCSAQLNYRMHVAVNRALNNENIVFDRWPLISDHIYGSPGSMVKIDASLRLARIDRIVFCDVDQPCDLRIESRPGDIEDTIQTFSILETADQRLEAYRVLMEDLRFLGHDIRRYTMRLKR